MINKEASEPCGTEAIVFFIEVSVLWNLFQAFKD